MSLDFRLIQIITVVLFSMLLTGLESTRRWFRDSLQTVIIHSEIGLKSR